MNKLSWVTYFFITIILNNDPYTVSLVKIQSIFIVLLFWCVLYIFDITNIYWLISWLLIKITLNRNLDTVIFGAYSIQHCCMLKSISATLVLSNSYLSMFLNKIIFIHSYFAMIHFNNNFYFSWISWLWLHIFASQLFLISILLQ